MFREWLSGHWDFLVFAFGAAGLFGGLAFGLWRWRRPPATLPRVFWLALIALVLAGFFFVEEAGRRPQRRVLSLLESIAQRMPLSWRRWAMRSCAWKPPSRICVIKG